MRSNETTALAVVAGKGGGHSYWGLNSKSETIKKQQYFGPYTHQQYSFGVFQKESIQACQNIKGASYKKLSKTLYLYAIYVCLFVCVRMSLLTLLFLVLISQYRSKIKLSKQLPAANSQLPTANSQTANFPSQNQQHFAPSPCKHFAR